MQTAFALCDDLGEFQVDDTICELSDFFHSFQLVVVLTTTSNVKDDIVFLGIQPSHHLGGQLGDEGC